MRTRDKVKQIFASGRFFFCAALLVLGLSGSAYAAAEGLPLRLSIEYARLEAAEPVNVAVLWIEPLDGYSIYSHAPQEAGFPTTVAVFAADDPGAAPLPVSVDYPEGTLKDDPLLPGGRAFIYEGRTPIAVRMDAAMLDRDLTLELKLLLCSAVNCIPVSRQLPLRLDAAALPALPLRLDPPWVVAPDPSNAPQPQSFTPTVFLEEFEVGGLFKALLFGFLAGIILNCMPCVLPVIGIKLSALLAVNAQDADGLLPVADSGGCGGQGPPVSFKEGVPDTVRRARFRQHSLLFSCGILSWFILLGLILGASGLIWGQLFQSPLLLFVLLCLVFLLGLSTFGLFTLPMFDLKAGKTAPPRLQPFFNGLLVTLLATPCSGPLLGGVLGWAFQQGPLRMGLVFIAVGLGMACPWLALAARPGFARRLPRPGRWMDVLEHLVGFFLMGTTIYLYSLLPETWYLPALITLFAIALAAWIWGRFGRLAAPPLQRLVAAVVALALICAVATFAFQDADEPNVWADVWEPFNAAAFTALLGQEPMLLEFTADWCPSCKLLEHSTLRAERILDLQKRYGFRSIRVDLTRESPEGTALLTALSSRSIPFVALFPAGERASRPTILRDLFTPQQLEQAARETYFTQP